MLVLIFRHTSAIRQTDLCRTITDTPAVKPPRPSRLSILLCFCFLLFASPAWAVQAHGGAEGLVAHEIGHLLFVAGMGYLLLRGYRLHPGESGWFEFKVFLGLIILWNIITFSGHWQHECIAPQKFLTANGTIHAFLVTSLSDAYFYLTRLDHLFLVPAFTFLLLALRKWRAR